MIASAEVRHYRSIDSTNLEAQRLFVQGERGPLWLVAEEQTKGRGRLGRSWLSPPGNLYSTLLLSPPAEVSRAAQLGFVVALAVSDVVASFAGQSAVNLKWPNDCLIKGAKVSGILCEVFAANPLCLALGCGINVASAPIGLPYPVTSLHAYGGKALVHEVFHMYQEALDRRFAQWLEGFELTARAWSERAIGIGEEAVVEQASGVIRGQIQSLSADGGLVLETHEGLRTILAGDVRIPTLAVLRSPAA